MTDKVRVVIHSFSHRRHAAMSTDGLVSIITSVSNAAELYNRRAKRIAMLAVYEVYWTPKCVQRMDGADGEFLRNALRARDAITEFSGSHPHLNLYADIETVPTQQMERVLKCSFGCKLDDPEDPIYWSLSEFLRHQIHVYFKDFAVREPISQRQFLAWGTHHAEATALALMKSYGEDTANFEFEVYNAELGQKMMR